MADADALLEPGVSGVPATPDPAPATPPADESVMSLVDHLGELRSRLFKALIAIGIGSAIGYLVAVPVRNFLILPLGPDRVLQVLGVGDAFVIQIKISIVIGIILAMPVLLYQVWAFVAPGLTPSERKTVRPWIPLALLFFAIGVADRLFHPAVRDRSSCSATRTTELVAQPAAGPYFDFVTTLFLVFGLIMEFPILLVGLSRVGIVTSERLTGSRRMIILGIAIFAAVVTPGGDLVSPIVLGSTMYILFELTVLFIKRTGK